MDKKAKLKAIQQEQLHSKGKCDNSYEPLETIEESYKTLRHRSNLESSR